jgi:UDP-N-acetylglucosamine--N-acetylmuramyl-(pentapeptide) pyrophosphoryl-undecaprenol N-acetylglucosamine transferase
MKIIMSGGDTAGHHFMAAALAEILEERLPSSRIVYVGARGRMGIDQVITRVEAVHHLKIQPLVRGSLVRNTLLPFQMALSIRHSLQIIRHYGPDLVLGLGGYPSGPLVYAATLRRIPSLIIEPNCQPGLTNKLLAGKVNTICTSFPTTRDHFPRHKTVLTGTPIRKSIVRSSLTKKDAAQRLGLNPDRKTLLVVGGSLGSRSLNEMVLHSLTALSQNQVQILWQTGARYFENSRPEMSADMLSQFIVRPFLANIEEAYAVADLVVSAAGAVTLAELAQLGKPAIIVPSSEVTEDHQRANALHYLKHEACVMITPDREGVNLAETVVALLHDEEELHRLSSKVRVLARPDAAERVLEQMGALLATSCQG